MDGMTITFVAAIVAGLFAAGLAIYAGIKRRQQGEGK